MAAVIACETQNRTGFGTVVDGEMRMADNDLFAEAYRAVRLRYLPEDFQDLYLNQVIEEVRKEAHLLEATVRVPGTAIDLDRCI